MKYLFYPPPQQTLLPLPKLILVTVADCCHLRLVATSKPWPHWPPTNACADADAIIPLLQPRRPHNLLTPLARHLQAPPLLLQLRQNNSSITTEKHNTN